MAQLTTVYPKTNFEKIRQKIAFFFHFEDTWPGKTAL